jgi:hypothetical protein
VGPRPGRGNGRVFLPRRVIFYLLFLGQ